MPGSLDPEERRLIRALTASSDRHAAGEALAALMQRYKGLTYAVALEISRDRSLADDVFQETFLRMTLWLRARTGIQIRSFSRLLCAFVRRTALELARRERHPPILEVSSHFPLVDAIYARDLLSALPQPARGVLERVLLRGMSGREAAAEMNLTPENVRLIKHRVLRAIREQQARDLVAVEGR